MARVHVPLAGSGVADDDEYARRIYLGWVGAPDPPSPHLRVTLERMDLHHDKELPGGDCQCLFFWMNIDRSPFDEWFRLSDYAQGDMDSYDDDRLTGNGYMDFSGPVFDFYARRPPESWPDRRANAASTPTRSRGRCPASTAFCSAATCPFSAGPPSRPSSTAAASAGRN